MKRIIRQLRRVWTVFPVLLLLVCACAKEADSIPRGYEDWPYTNPDNATSDMAIGTVRSRDNIRYIQLDAASAGFVVNPEKITGIADGTRVFLQFVTVVSPSTPAFCTDAILVEWASLIDQGGVSMLNFEESFSEESIAALTYSSPMNLVFDWMTSLEDGFLTLHYTIPTSGEKKHRFALYRSMYNRNQYYLIHNADGDTKGSETDGIVCFEVSSLLPKTDGQKVELSFVYIDLNHTEKRLTVEYCSPK